MQQEFNKLKILIDKQFEMEDDLKALSDKRLELLKRCASHLSFILDDYSEFGAVYHPNVPEITDLNKELAEAIAEE